MQFTDGSDTPQQQQKQSQAAPAPPQHMHPPPPPPQWMAMQYASPAAAAAAMVMPPHPMMAQHYPPHYFAYHHPPPPQPPLQHQQPQQNNQNQQQQGSNAENKTIWVGDLTTWMDESYLHGCFASTGEVATIKIIRNKQTGLSEGYGFVEFYSHATAEKVLQTYANIPMPNTDQCFRLNWAAFSMGDKRSDSGSDLSIFVGDLAADVTDSLLHETFASKYPSVKGAKVVVDGNTGRSKGYGFVRFGDDNERTLAMTEMNGQYCSSRAMRINVATPRKAGYQQQYSSQGGYASNGAPAQGTQSEEDSMNTTIFVGGLDPSVTVEDLRQPFSQHGEIVNVKIPPGKGCGFVQFANRNNAEAALESLNKTVIGKQTVRLSWGRNPANKQSRHDSGNQWNGAYYGGQIFDGYGYALPQPQYPSMYAAAAMPYGAYPTYGNHQQQVS